MPMTDEQKAVIRQRQVNDLKQACLDLANAGGELFDRLDEHGLEAAWVGDGALVVMRMAKAYEDLRQFLADQSVRRLVALGVPAASLLRTERRR